MKNVKKQFVLFFAATFPLTLSLGAWAGTALPTKKTVRANSGKTKSKSESVKIKNIPRLNIEQEKQVKSSLVSPLLLPVRLPAQLPSHRDHQIEAARINKSLPVLTTPGSQFIDKVTSAKIFVSTESLKKIPDIKNLPSVKEPATESSKISVQNLHDMQPNDYKLLQALIFLEIQKNYELAMGLFAELMDDPKHRTQALYNYALTAKGLRLNSEFRQYMSVVAHESKDKDWQRKAAEALVENIDLLETSDIQITDALVQKFDLDVSKNDDYQITRAKYYSEKGNLGQLEDALIYISEKSPRYPEALLLSGLFNYRQGKIEDATLQLEHMMELTKNQKNLPLRSVGALTLARLQFQKSDYKAAFQSYLQVDKSSSLWLQAMVESAWTQILSEDYEGAAGNMFSLHTDFFKNAFSPESYVVRTVGYLNLCQYGDGAHVLSDMNKKYAPWKKKLEEYQIKNRNSSNYYETVKKWLTSSELKEVDGLPRSFIVELARHPSFTALQKQINNFEDEIERFNGVALNLVKLEREILVKQNETNKDLLEAKKSIKGDAATGILAQKIHNAEQKLLSYRIQSHIANKARVSIKTLKEKAFVRIEKEKSNLRSLASLALQKRFKEMLASLDHVMDQNEVLKYELYSGAGEHIRYQMAGGDINQKDRPELKVEKDKSLNWKFKGEIWEDEVGHYRSSLKNVCPQESNVAGLAQ